MQLAELVTREPAVRFRRRPVPIAPDHRVLWRVAAVVVLLRSTGRGEACRSSLRRLHVLSWGTRSDMTRAHLMEQLQATAALGGPFVSVDPALNLAIEFAVGEGLVVREAHGRLALTASGSACADEIISAGLLASEASRAKEIKNLATEGNIKNLLRRAAR
jgi:hypothetical protein